MAASLPSFDSNATPPLTNPPNPTWSIGKGIRDDSFGAKWAEGEKTGWTVVDASTENPMKLYAMMVSGIVPRPIAFTSTMSPEGVHNLAPFSWFNMISAVPPLVLVSCSNIPGRVHDTTNNIRATKEFTVNIISEPFVHQANFTSIDAPEGRSEWPASGLTMAPSLTVKPPRVKESAFSMECTLFHIYDIKPPGGDIATTTALFGLVKKIHIRNDVMTPKGFVDPKVFKPVAKLGDISYARLGGTFMIPNQRDQWVNVAEQVDAFEEGSSKDAH